MNRIRSIKPEMRRNRKIADCGVLATLLSRDLITYADDQGRFRASAREIKAECLPYFDNLKSADVEKALVALADPAVGFVELYEVGGERYGWIPGWFRHQQLKSDRVTWSDLPPPPSYRPDQMAKALYARWLQDASTGDLPGRGDGALAETQGNPDGDGSESLVSNLETDRSESGAEPERPGDVLEPRARRRAGADRTGPGPGPERSGPGTRAESPPPVMPMPLSPEVKQRVGELHDGCLAILAARPLRNGERDLVLGWATTLRRAGELVPVPEVLAVVRRKMAERTPEGGPPANLGWCADDVAALARERAGPTLESMPRAAQEAVALDRVLAERAEQLRRESR